MLVLEHNNLQQFYGVMKFHTCDSSPIGKIIGMLFSPLNVDSLPPGLDI